MNSLVVPISVEALCVNGVSSDVFLGPIADFSGIADGQRCLSDAIVTMPNVSLENGIHLHWALPDGLTHGERDEISGRIVFPAVPNRWLVTRLHAGGADPAHPVSRTAAWVIESDYLNEQALPGQAAVPLRSPSGDRRFGSMGRTTPLAQWREGMTGTSDFFKAQTGHPLTAIGYGETSFAAYYPNCRGVFGFHDDLATLTDYDHGNDRVSYVVCGWFSEGKGDPLAGGIAGSDNALGWGFDPGQDALPERTICSGMVQGIVWEPTADYTPRVHDPLEVTVGDSPMECLSALLANRPALSDNLAAERLLNEVQLGLLAGLASTPGWAAQVDAAVHAQRFASTPGGQIWTIRAGAAISGEKGSTTSDDLHAVGARVGAELPLAIGEQLNALNLLQQQSDQASRELVTLREQLFHDWYRYIQVLRQPTSPVLAQEIPDFTDDDAYGKLLSALQQFVEKQAKTVLPACQQDADRLAARVKEAAASLKGALFALDSTLLLEQTAAPRFWEPNDPVVLLMGEAVRPSLRYGADDQFHPSGALPCRMPADLFTGVTLTQGDRHATLTAASLAPALPLDQLPASNTLAALIAEAVLSDPAHAAFVAAALASDAGAAGIAGVDAVALRRDVAALQNALAEGRTTAGALAFAGKAPCILALSRPAGAPWIPLFMRWSVDFRPIRLLGSAAHDGPLPGDLVTARYQLDPEGADLIDRGPVPAQIQSCEGTVALSPKAWVRLKDQIDQYLTHNPDPALQAISDKLSLAPMMTQGLSGFNQALRMRAQTIQLEVRDPLADDSQSARNGAVADAVQDWNYTAPQPLDSFNPVRAGVGALSAIRLVDAFGRMREVDLKTANFSRSVALTPVDPKARAAGLFQLPARIVQPARLVFRFLAAADDQVEMNSHPATSPICGWVIPNFLDDALDVYAQKGKLLGALDLISGGKKLRWRPAAEVGDMVASGADAAAQAALVQAEVSDPHLQRFVLGILRSPAGASYLDRIIRAVDRALGLIHPIGGSRDTSLSGLIGRPLAVVRASLALELYGAPAAHLGWPSLLDDVRRGAGSARDTRGFTQVQFAVRLGELEHIDDGLVGYFVENQQSVADYQKFFSPGAPDDGATDVLPNWANPVQLIPDASAKPLLMTLLVEPHGKVKATSGILPVKTLALPPSQYEADLQSLSVEFRAGTLLFGKGKQRLPLPAIEGFGWSWMQVLDTAWTQNEAVIGTTDRAEIGYSVQTIREGRLRLAPVKAPDRQKAT